MRTDRFLPVFALMMSACTSSLSEKDSSSQKFCEVPAQVFTNEHKVSINSTSTQLEVIIKNSCEKPGEITRLIPLDPHAKGKVGVRSYSLTKPDGMDPDT